MPIIYYWLWLSKLTSGLILFTGLWNNCFHFHHLRHKPLRRLGILDRDKWKENLKQLQLLSYNRVSSLKLSRFRMGTHRASYTSCSYSILRKSLLSSRRKKNRVELDCMAVVFTLLVLWNSTGRPNHRQGREKGKRKSKYLSMFWEQRRSRISVVPAVWVLLDQ